MCGHPAYSEQSFSPASGEYSVSHRTPVTAARADEGLCGPEALLFEPNTVVYSAFRGLKIAAGDIAAILGAIGITAGLTAMLLGW